MVIHTIQVGLLPWETIINRQLTFHSRDKISVIKSKVEGAEYNKRRSLERATEEKSKALEPMK